MGDNSHKILLVDDEADVLEFIGYNLKKAGYQVYTADNAQDAIEMAKSIKPHLILLDVMMPGMDGVEACEEMRKHENLKDTIIAFLTARGEDYSQIAGFEAGGDDYITKPIKPKVLLSRIKALLKRYKEENNSETESNVIRKSDLIIDKEKYQLKKDNQEIVLPKKEFELLLLLISKPDKVFTREEIFNRVWGDNIVVGDRTIDVHIRKLREKIGDEHIRTVKGVGYKYVD